MTSTRITRGCYNRISATYGTVGKFYFEMWIRTPASGKTWCDLAIHLIDPEHHKADDLLIGVEVKDWKNPVPPSVIRDEFEGYRHQFDYFYLAANEFGATVEDAIDNDYIGLISIPDRFEIIKQPRAQPTFSWNRQAFIEAVDRNWRRKHDSIQRTHPWLAAVVDGEARRQNPGDEPADADLATFADR